MDLAGLPAGEVALRLGAACAVGAAVGLDRELQHKAAGLRTHMLLALGSALFLLLAAGPEVPATASGRVLQGLTSGLGFLSAGQILRHRLPVGVTTAADLWVVGALGAASGMGFYALSLATAAGVVLILRLLVVLETRLLRTRGRARRA